MIFPRESTVGLENARFPTRTANSKSTTVLALRLSREGVSGFSKSNTRDGCMRLKSIRYGITTCLVSFETVLCLLN